MRRHGLFTEKEAENAPIDSPFLISYSKDGTDKVETMRLFVGQRLELDPGDLDSEGQSGGVKVIHLDITCRGTYLDLAITFEDGSFVRPIWGLSKDTAGIEQYGIGLRSLSVDYENKCLRIPGSAVYFDLDATKMTGKNWEIQYCLQNDTENIV